MIMPCSLPYIPLGRRAIAMTCLGMNANLDFLDKTTQLTSTQYLLRKLGTTRKSQTVPPDMLKLRPDVFATIPLQKISLLGL